MKFIVAAFIPLAMIVACAPAQPVAFIGPRGKPAYKIDCLDDEKYCEPQAKEFCPNGYSLISDRPHIVAIWQGVDVVNRIRFELIIECE